MSSVALGIDIAKLKFNACLLRGDGKLKHKVFVNTAAGFDQLAGWLIKQHITRVHACLEATGSYGEALALFLHGAGHAVSVMNPAAIKAYAASRLSRTKTDRVDAEVIARFCATQRPTVWAPPAPEVRALQALVRRLESLVEMRVAESNRAAAGGVDGDVQRSLEEHLSYLRAEIKRTEALIRGHIATHPRLRQQCALLVSIPGIGEATAAMLLAEVAGNKHYTSARQVAAYAGLAPRERQSGSSVRGRARLSKVGSPRLRRALYFPALTALRCNPLVRQWAERLRARGKCKMVVVGAAMRKLMHLAYGVLKTGCPFDPQWAKTA